MVGEEMNLVELKGYNHTKDHLDKNRSSMLEESVISLESQLLQYRREHNIFECGDRVYSSLYNEKGFVDHINISSGKRQYWVKPDNDSCQFIALEGQIKPLIKLKAELA